MNLLAHTPQFDTAAAVQIAFERYGLDATAKPLPSERDQNFRLTTDDGQQFVLKIANGLEDVAFLGAQQQAWAHLSDKGIDFCPQAVPTSDGLLITAASDASGATFATHLVTYLPGKPVGEIARHSDALLRDLGQKLGRCDVALADFDHPAVHREFHWDLAQGMNLVARQRHLVGEPALLSLIEHFMTDIEQHTRPLLATIPTSVIHNDANDFNVLAGGGSGYDGRNQTVTGLIDFGDMVYSYTVGNLAIAAAYMLLGKADPLTAMATLVTGYHAVRPLAEDEVAALFGLITLRLCVSVCMAAVHTAARPGDDYLSTSQEPIHHALPLLAQIPYGFATAVFRNACGYEPVPQTEPVLLWLQAQPGASILGPAGSAEAMTTLDLGVGSPLLHGAATANSPDLLLSRIAAELARQGKSIGIGRYNEPRLWPNGPTWGMAATPLAGEQGTIHLGLDLFLSDPTAVYAPLAGVVAAVDSTAGRVMLAHRPGPTAPFFTLYTGLSQMTLTPGQKIEAGEHLGITGNDLTRLQIQLIRDHLGLGVAFPSMGHVSQRAVWQSLCPDPNLIVRLPAEQATTAVDTFAHTVAQRRSIIGRNLSLGYRRPLKIVRGWQQYLWDHTGTKYLDAYNNVPHVGHCHPRVVAAAQQQMSVLNTNTRYLHDNLNSYAERLTATLPDPLNVCFFVNSASEANELALRLVRAHTGRQTMIVLEGAYHGHTTGLIDISPYKHDGPGGQGAPDWVHTVPIPDVYRGPFKADVPDVGQKYAATVPAVLDRIAAAGQKLGGFIAETCPSVGGQIFLPADYLTAVYAAVRAAGGLTIADEVQTGYGRIGTHFYAFEAHDVVPDIVILGKPIGNGHPIGALITTAEIADSFNNGMEFFSTFGGNTVSCAVGIAVLDVVQQENLQAHAAQVGRQLLAGLQPFVDQYKIVGDVRGSGLFLGMELVHDRQTLAPAADAASFVVNQLREAGILAGTDGPLHNVVKIRPPMPFDTTNADFLVSTLDQILRTDFAS